MFFAPPKVKSLSRYAEFGTYLRQRDFFLMVGVAIFLHACIIGYYSMAPHEEVVRIPVRVLNIKLGGGESNSAIEMPMPVVMPQQPQAAAVGVREAIETRPAANPSNATEHLQSTQNLLDKAFKPGPSKAVYDSHMKHSHGAQPAVRTASAASTFETPKKYVREVEPGTAAGQGHGTGLGAGGKGSDKSGAEIVERYEQAISFWISEHKAYPPSAKQQGIEGDAIVRIRIDRNGHILYNAIDRSSGNTLIDQAVIAMVHASDPVPHVPEDYPEGSQLEFLIPVSFRLQ